MKIIVDAYNVLYAKLKREKIHEFERKQFINQLSDYAKKKKHEIIVVFDGGPCLFVTTVRDVAQGVTIIYSGPNDTADDLIIQYIQQNVGCQILLVSSDRQLCKLAYNYKVDAIESTYFYDYLVAGIMQEKSMKECNDKAFKMGNAENVVDLLMLQTIVQKKAEDVADAFLDGKLKHKSPKKKRNLMHKLKKL